MAKHNPSVLEALREHPFLQGVGEGPLKRLASFSALAYYETDDVILRAGERAITCHLIREGRVAITVHDPKRHQIVLQTLGEGSVAGWSWLTPPYRWCFDARAVSNVKTIAVAAEDLRKAFADDHEFGFEMLQRFTEIFAERLHAARFQLLDLYSA